MSDKCQYCKDGYNTVIVNNEFHYEPGVEPITEKEPCEECGGTGIKPLYNDDVVWNDCIESDRGAWQYTKDGTTGEMEIQYYRPDDAEPHTRIPVTQDDLDDLETLIDNIKRKQ